MINRYLSLDTLGAGIIDAGDGKITVALKDVSGLIMDGTEVSIDATVLGTLLSGKLDIVFDDANNIIQADPANGQAFLDEETIQLIIGKMVLDDMDGIKQDAVTKALSAYIYDMQVENTNSIAMTMVSDSNGDGKDGDFKFKADVILDTDTNNATTITPNGVMTPKPTAPTIETASDGTKSLKYEDGTSIQLELVSDTQGSNQFLAIMI